MKSTTLLAAVVALAALVANADQPKVISVHDGDTLKVVQDGQQTTIRLHGIDAPEIGQAFLCVAHSSDSATKKEEWP